MGRQHLTRPTGGRRASATANPNTHLHAGKTTGPAPATSHGQTPTPQGPHGHAGSGALKEPTLPRRGEGERPSPQRQRGGVGAAPGPRRARHRRHEGEDAGSALGHKSRTRRGNGHGIPPPHTRAVPRRLGHRSPPLATLHIFSHAHPRAPPPGPLHATAPTTAHTGRPSRHLPPIQPSGSPCPEKHRDPEGTLPRGDHAGRGGREGWAQPNTRADRRPTTASRSPGWRAGEAESCPLAPQPQGRAGRTTRAPAKPRPTRQHTESDAEGTRAHGHARRSPTRRKSDGPPARPGGTLPRHGGGRRGPRPLGPKEQRPGPHRGDRQTHQHAYASPQQKGQTGRTGGVRHPTHSAQEGRRPGDNGTPSEGTPLSRIAREGVPHRRWATPHPNCPPPPGRQEASRGSTTRETDQSGEGVCGIGKKRHLEHPRPGQGQAGRITNPIRHSPPGPRTRPARPDHTATARHTWHTPPHGGRVASAQACAHQADTPHTRGDDGTTPAASLQARRSTHVSPSLTASTPPRLPRGTGSSQRQPQQRHPGEGAGGTGATPPLGFRHLRHNLDHSRGTAQARAEARLRSHRAHDRATARDARHVRGPRPPPRAKARGQQRPGRFPHPCHPHTTRRWGRQNEGPAGQNERLSSIHHERLSLIWSGLGPAQESATAPHRSQSGLGFNTWSEGGGTRPGEDSHQRGPLQPHQPPPLTAGGRQPQRRTPDTHTWHEATPHRGPFKSEGCHNHHAIGSPAAESARG